MIKTHKSAVCRVLHYNKTCTRCRFRSALDAILAGAKKVSVQKPKPGNKNQKPFERILIMEYELAFIGKVKMTVGVRRRTQEKVQYCITAIRNAE